MAYDLIVRGGRIVDGTGLPAYLGDVGIRDGKIVEIGRLQEAGARVLDAAGLAVAPGFIDHHTHYDAQLLWDPLGSSSCWHGVTTVITGNCSLSLAPCKPADRDGIVGCFVRVEAISRKALEAGVGWEWTDFGGYLDRLERERGINVACYVGHSAVRQHVMGEASSDRVATPDEIAAMREAVRAALAAGAIGLSLNQSKHHFREDGRPLPANVAPAEEVLALASVLGEQNAGTIQLNGGVLGAEVAPRDAFRLLRQIAEASGRPVLYNSIMQRQENDVSDEAMALADELLRDGHRVHGTGSALPIGTSFTLKIAQDFFRRLPTWAAVLARPPEAIQATLRDPAQRAALRAEGAKQNWDVIEIVRTRRPEHKAWEGRMVGELAAELGKDPANVLLDLALAEDLDTRFRRLSANVDRTQVARILAHPGVIVGTSDAGAHVKYQADYGYCTEFLGPWVRDRRIMSLERAVHLLTLFPASIFGLHDRGQLRPGFAADLVIFDPATIGAGEPASVADFPAGEERLVQPAFGVHATVVNGEVLVENGRHTGALPGRVLRNAMARS
jgi:N-acyl-D-aspartate/D-glutamate deacylase